MQIAEIAPLQAEKMRLTQLFQKALKPLRRRAAASTALAGPREGASGWSRGTRLAGAAMENERALRIGRAATERLVAAIVAAVTQSRRPPDRPIPARRRDRAAPRVAGIAVDHRL